MPRQNRTLRTLRGGGTSSYTFNPASHVMNNPVAWRSEAIEGGVRSMPSVSSHGLPMQRGGGGGASYGFVGPSGFAGGMAAISSTHCQPLPVASLNTRGGELWTQGGGKRNATKRKTSKQNKNKSNRSRKNRNKSKKNKRSNNKRN